MEHPGKTSDCATTSGDVINSLPPRTDSNSSCATLDSLTDGPKVGPPGDSNAETVLLTIRW